MAQKNFDLQILKDTYNLLPGYIEIEQETTYCTGPSYFDYLINKKSKWLNANERIKMSNCSNYLQFKAAVKSLLSDAQEENKQVERSFNNLFTQLTPVYSEGDTFNKVEGLFKFISSEEGYKTEKTTFQPTLGQVTLIEFWSTKQDPFMAHNLNMLEQNKEKWLDKVEIIEIQFDNQPEFVKQTIIDKKLDSIQHYMFMCSENYFRDQIEETPFIFLLDKQARIQYKGDPNKTNLEIMINKFIQAEFESNEKNEEKQSDKQCEGKEKGELKQFQQDQSKKLKTFFKNELNNIAKNMYQEEITFTVKFIKANKINRDGTKENIKKQYISLSYKADVEQKQLIETFISDIWNKIPEDQRIIKKARINDVELDKKLIKEKFTDAAKQLGIYMSFGPQKVKTFTFANELCEFSLDEQLNRFVKCQLSAEDFKKWQDLLREFVGSYKGEQMEFIDHLTDIIRNSAQSIYLHENDQFQTIDSYHKLDQEIQQITHKPDQVLVIVYWAKGSEQCANEIKKNTLLLENNAQKWGDKLRFVYLSLILDYECKNFMEGIKKSQEYIEFYFPEKEEQSDYEKYGEGHLPHYVIVDKQGKIRVIGKFQNLEELINQLLDEENQEGQEMAQEKVYLNQEQMNQIQTLLKSNKVKELLSGLNNQYTFSLQLQFEEEWGKQEGSDEEVFLKYNQPQLSYFVRKPQIEKFSLFLDQVYAIISKDNFKIDESISNTIDIPFPGKECVVCKKELNDQVQQYYSPFKNEFLCCECAEFDDKSKKGLARFKYTDTLIFINAPLTDLSVLKDIDDHKIGNNLKIGDDEEGRQSYDIYMACNGCMFMKEGPRYISISARPGRRRGGGYVEYCAGCFEKLKNKDSEEAKKIVEIDAEDGMVSDSCLVRILFNLGYQNF